MFAIFISPNEVMEGSGEKETTSMTTESLFIRSTFFSSNRPAQQNKNRYNLLHVDIFYGT